MEAVNDLQQDEVEPKKARLGKWQPKKWRPEYDRIVGYSVLGKSNIEIATNFGLTKEHISTILNLPQAKELAEKLQIATKQRMLENIPDTLDYVARKTTERLKQMIDDDELFDKSPFAVIDRGVDILKGLSHLRGGGNGANAINVEKAIIVPAEQAKDFFRGMTKADEARRINGNTNKPVAIIEGPKE